MAVVPQAKLPAPTARREQFLAALAPRLEQLQRKGQPLCFALVDIDLLGRINKEHGREAGDPAIAALGTALARDLGMAESARVGGDAYAVVWPGAEREAAFLTLEQFRNTFAAPAPLRGVTLRVSAGLAASPEDGTKAHELFQKASEALYRAKATGRGKVCLAREEKMVTKTSHYTQGQLMGLRRLAEREGIKDAELLREALNDLLRKYNA